MLHDLGLTVWVDRARLRALQPAGEAASVASNEARLQALRDSLEPTTNRAAKPVRPEAAKPVRPEAAKPVPRQAARPVGPSPETPPIAAVGSASAPGSPTLPAVVQCTWLNHWLYLGVPRSDATCRRFLLDVLRAPGALKGTPQQLEFAVAELARDLGAEQAQAALLAFVNKRIDVTQVAGVLLETSLTQWQNWLPVRTQPDSMVAVLQSGPQRELPVLLLPDLVALMRDGQAKRRFWLALQSLGEFPAGSAGSADAG